MFIWHGEGFLACSKNRRLSGLSPSKDRSELKHFGSYFARPNWDWPDDETRLTLDGEDLDGEFAAGTNHEFLLDRYEGYNAAAVALQREGRSCFSASAATNV